MQPTNSKPRLWPWLAALFLVIVGAKLWLIRVWATPIPYWDQWDEARLWLKPWLDGNWTWSELFAPHNEHRIFFTRVLDTLVIQLNGQWDPLLQMTINAFIHAGYACGLAACLWFFAGKKCGGLICFLLAPFFALPFAAENTIHGFQSQMYFLDIFSLAAIVGLGFAAPGTRWWFLGLAAGILSIFTMASGLLASLAVAGLVVLRMLKQRGVFRNQFVTLGCALAILIFGFALNVTVESDKQFQAKSLMYFLNALMVNLAWPFSNQPFMCYFVCLPLAVVVVKYFRPGFKNSRAAEFILVFGLWGFLQAAALAYGRSGGVVSSRYMDILTIIPIASLGSLLLLAEELESLRLPARAVTIAAVLWAGILFFGLGQTSQATMTGYLPQTKKWESLEQKNVQAFLSTGDTNYLLHQPLLAIPYWNPAGLIDLLRDPKLSVILPPACRAPAKPDGDEFQQMAPLSRGAALLLNHGVAILWSGLVLFAGVAGFCALQKFRRTNTG